MIKTASVGNADTLYREAIRLGIRVPRKRIEDYLLKQLAYTLHKHARKRFVRNKTTSMYIDEVWQMDLCETHMLKYKDGDKYIC